MRGDYTPLVIGLFRDRLYSGMTSYSVPISRLNLPIEPPPCPVHAACPVHKGPCTEIEQVAEVLPGHLAVIAPPQAFDAFTGGGDVPHMHVREDMPHGYPAQLLYAQALLAEDAGDNFDLGCADIEPMRGGAFALSAGVVIEINCCKDACLYSPVMDAHCILANFLSPNPN